MKIDRFDTTILSELTVNPRARRARRAFEHGDRAAAEGAGGRRFHPWLSGDTGSDSVRAVHHRSGQGHAGKPKRGRSKILRSRGDRLSIGGSMLSDFGTE